MKYLLIAIVLLASCGSSVTEGYVVEKKYTKEWIQSVPMQIGKITVLQPVVHPASWSLKLRGTVKGKQAWDWVSVSRWDYEKADSGDYYYTH